MADRVPGIPLPGPREPLRFRPVFLYQLKIVQEVVTLPVFIAFAWIYFGEGLRWQNLAAFACVLGAVGFGFWGRV